LLNVVLSLEWLPTLGARGLLLANSASQTMQAVLLVFLIRRLVARSIDWRALLVSASKIGLSSAVMVAVLHWIAALGAQPDASIAARGWFLFGQVAIGALSFLAAARLLGVEELSIIVSLLMQKFLRNVPSPLENREGPIA
jgi:peptidoglycan biosynthesis protein MviN/MurJ (putative lipid II flippase)